jgi:hypothetical protein
LVWRAYASRNISIVHPRPNEVLTEPEPLGSGLCFPIRGRLKYLPKGHEIWILSQDEVSGLVWPQGFFAVQYDPSEGTWLGKISGSGKQNVKIVAVVAPPTSQDYFRYFQEMGNKNNYQYRPLKRIPPECRNQAHVQARIQT